MATSNPTFNPAPERALFDRIRRSLERDRELPAAHLALKAMRYGLALASAPLYLLGCDHVGPGVRTMQRPLIDNAGYIGIGARVIMNSRFAPIQLSAGPGGRIEIGDDDEINFGVAISAAREVTLGRRVRFGPYVTISDTDGKEGLGAGPEPIRIGDDVWLASRVRVRKGAVIGSGSVISAGSDVIGEIPPNVVAGGAPARPLRPVKNAAAPEASADAPPQGATGHSREGEAKEGAARRALRRADRVVEDAVTRLLLAGVDRVGDRPRAHGLPFIENFGQILIGDDLRLVSTPVRVRLVAGRGAALRLGNQVTIGPGASIAATTQIDIDDGVTLGPFVTIIDSNYHAVEDRSKKGAAAPIVIGANARLDEGVIVLRGARIGRDAHIAAGSVVSGTIPDGAFAAGVRARVITPAERAPSSST